MAFQLPNGTTLDISKTLGPETDIDTLTNANPAIATVSASHGAQSGDYAVIKSGWSALNNRAVRFGVVASNDVPLLGINSLNTIKYPAGAGIGSYQEVIDWVQMSQVLEPASQGGEQQYTVVQPLEADFQLELPTVKTPYRLTMQLGDDPSLDGYKLCEEANEDKQPRVIRANIPGGSILLLHARISVNTIPTFSVNEVMTVALQFALVAEPVRYAAS